MRVIIIQGTFGGLFDGDFDVELLVGENFDVIVLFNISSFFIYCELFLCRMTLLPLTSFLILSSYSYISDEELELNLIRSRF